jgi:hypothetical protein
VRDTETGRLDNPAHRPVSPSPHLPFPVSPCPSSWVVDMKHLTMAELKAGLDEIRRSPKDEGVVELIVRRPQLDEREVLEEGELSLLEGLVGDSWKRRRSSSTADRSPHPEMQLNVMNSRTIALVAQSKERWPLAGDQIFLDLDLSAENLPAGTKLALGSAVIEVTAPPHLGCKKFVSRFGLDAMKFVNSPLGKELHLRGINAKVTKPDMFRVGDMVKKV